VPKKPLLQTAGVPTSPAFLTLVLAVGWLTDLPQDSRTLPPRYLNEYEVMSGGKNGDIGPSAGVRLASRFNIYRTM